MMSRGLKIVLAANLLVLAALVFIYPHLMVGPGKLIAGHKHLETDCFACHAPLMGSSVARCQACHQPARIGLSTSDGRPIVRTTSPVPFHQKLTERNCLACHSDHAGTRRFLKQGRFDHALLQATAREQCQSCHQAPSDALHAQIAGNCGQCHDQKRWTPATFDHDRYFTLDRDHNARCITCHQGNDYRRYTCYGCHEHSLAGIRREHIEEGIGNFDNCVECHRSGNKHDIRGKGGEREEHDD
jgi:hypothetical protein